MILLFSVFFMIYSLMEFDDRYEDFYNESAFVRQDETGLTTLEISDFAGEDADVEKRSSGAYFYSEDIYMTEFYYTGIYDGSIFSYSYESGGSEVARITRNIEPGNGVMNAYIIAKAVEKDDMEKLKANIYVDEDVIENFGSDLNLIWGRDWEEFRQAQFTEVAPGIYQDTVFGSHVERIVHGSPVSDANVAVGTFSQEEIQDGSIRDIDFAVMMR